MALRTCFASNLVDGGLGVDLVPLRSLGGVAPGRRRRRPGRLVERTRSRARVLVVASYSLVELTKRRQVWVGLEWRLGLGLGLVLVVASYGLRELAKRRQVWLWLGLGLGLGLGLPIAQRR